MLKGRHSINSWFVGNTAPRAKATPLWIHLPTLVNICLTLVKRHKLAKGNLDIFPAELWRRYKNEGNLCSVCQEEYFGPCLFERVTDCALRMRASGLDFIADRAPLLVTGLYVYVLHAPNVV